MKTYLQRSLRALALIGLLTTHTTCNAEADVSSFDVSEETVEANPVSGERTFTDHFDQSVDLSKIVFSDFLFSFGRGTENEFEIAAVDTLVRQLLPATLPATTNVRHYAFLEDALYRTTCSEGSSGCSTRDTVTMLASAKDELSSFRLFLTTAHEIAHTIPSESQAYSTASLKVVEEAKAMLGRYLACVALRQQDVPSGDACFLLSLSDNVEKMFPTYAHYTMSLFESVFSVNDGALEAGGTRREVYYAAHSLLSVLLIQHEGDLVAAMKTLLITPPVKLYTKLSAQQATLEELFHVGVAAVNAHLGTQYVLKSPTEILSRFRE